MALEGNLMEKPACGMLMVPPLRSMTADAV
jgi:hypothetical protein